LCAGIPAEIPADQPRSSSGIKIVPETKFTYHPLLNNWGKYNWGKYNWDKSDFTFFISEFVFFFSATALLVVQLVWQAFLSDAALSYVMHTSVDSASTSHSSPQSTCTYMYMMSCIANHSLLKQAMAAVWVEKMLIAPSL